MILEPKIEMIAEKKLVGNHIKLSFAAYDVTPLWRGFGPKRKEIKNATSTDLISISIYPPRYFTDFNPTNIFEKWATVEVLNFDSVPDGMETFVLPSGLYAVFSYRGLNTDHSIFEYIYKSWLPSSPYRLDDRPHFEVLGAKYKNNDPTSEEDIYIPVI
ncbi:MAG: GyrI-like domain-containing protein [Bdellovibrio sp.]|nr:GyrI-like domain-containing protein [Bdellovibrio sp.]